MKHASCIILIKYFENEEASQSSECFLLSLLCGEPKGLAQMVVANVAKLLTISMLVGAWFEFS